MKVLSSLLTAMMITGCASGRFGPSRVFTPQQINQNLDAFDGRTVRIRGFVTIGVEERTMYESKALLLEGERRRRDRGFDPVPWQKYCLTLTNALEQDANLLAHNHRTVELLARVDKEYGAKAIDLGACAIHTGISVVRVLSVDN